MYQGKCPKCQDRGDFHGKDCIAKRLFLSGRPITKKVCATDSIQEAVEALVAYKRKLKMKFDLGGESNKTNLIKLKNGQSITGVFKGEVYHFKQHWIDKRASLCKGIGCLECVNVGKPSFRFRLNLVYHDADTRQFVVGVFEQGWKTYQALKEINAASPLEDNILIITRKGEGTDTTYSFEVKRAVDPELNKTISNVELLDLSFHQKAPEEVFAEDLPF